MSSEYFPTSDAILRRMNKDGPDLSVYSNNKKYRVHYECKASKKNPQGHGDKLKNFTSFRKNSTWHIFYISPALEQCQTELLICLGTSHVRFFCHNCMQWSDLQRPHFQITLCNVLKSKRMRFLLKLAIWQHRSQAVSGCRSQYGGLTRRKHV